MHQVEAIAGNESDTNLSTSSIIEKSDGWIFTIEGGKLTKHICVTKNYKVFSPVLIPATEQKTIDEAPDIESLKHYGLADFNSGEI